MSSPAVPNSSPERALAQFFAEIESGDGATLKRDDHRALVASVRKIRGRLSEA